MKFLVIGLGSMGKRRVRNLKALGETDVTGFDPRPDRRGEATEKYGIATIDSLDKAAALKADAWVISTPPDTHMNHAFKAIKEGASFFTEAGTPDERIAELAHRLEAASLVGAPSCTMRYWAGPRKIMEVLQGGEIGRPLSFTYHFGQYLPDWHPWERIQDYYVSKRETGAAREIVAFELAWLMEAFGRPKRVWGAKGRLGDLDVDIDDTYQVLLDHGGVLGHMLIEVNARAALRLFRVVATEGTIEWDHVANEVRVYRAATKAWETVSLVAGNVEPGYMHAEDYYIEEMRDFVAAVRRERPFPHDYAAEVRLQQVVLAVEDSAAGGVEVP